MGLTICSGAGPVGCLAALAFAKEGCRVEIYEGRPGIVVGLNFISL